MIRFLFFLSCILSFSLQAEVIDLGVYGALFEIEEEDIQHVILNKLHTLQESGDLEKHHQKIAERVHKKMKAARSLEGLQTTTEARSFVYDPTLVVKKDMRLPDGRLLHKKGKKVNPFDHMDLGQTLLFLDGEDERQVTWAQSFEGITKWILVKGRPFALEKRQGHPVYFDQFGKITKQLGIKQVPAFVKQEGKVLRIREIKLDEQ